MCRYNEHGPDAFRIPGSLALPLSFKFGEKREPKDKSRLNQDNIHQLDPIVAHLRMKKHM